MRTHGTLTKWNEDRGFGFIAPARGDDVFAHISAFPRDDVRPRIGELVSFEIETGSDGRKRAVRIQRPSHRSVSSTTRGNRAPPPSLAAGVAAIAIVAIGALLYFNGDTVFSHAGRTQATDVGETRSVAGSPVRAGARALRSTLGANARAPEQDTTTAATFSCDGRRYCSQMTSCAEATYFLRNCPNVRMDGDRDGVPCEEQWCTQ